MNTLKCLIQGYKNFRNKFADQKYDDYRKYAYKQQNPDIMIIGCSDSRVNPAVITSAELGDIFVVNNVANLVPPYETTDNAHHGTSAAMEFAVKHLNVRHIIVLGHSQCGGIRALLNDEAIGDESYSFIKPWMSIIDSVKDDVKKNHGDLSIDEQAHICERSSLVVSLDNLLTFPWIKERVDSGKLHIHAWHFELSSAKIDQYNRKSDK
ncbi:carbonic anhydrase, partial [Rickettsiales bacterium]|nr:carbonic anhydrase [Rickettsiales bacterium]